MPSANAPNAACRCSQQRERFLGAPYWSTGWTCWDYRWCATANDANAQRVACAVRDWADAVLLYLGGNGPARTIPSYIASAIEQAGLADNGAHSRHLQILINLPSSEAEQHG